MKRFYVGAIVVGLSLSTALLGSNADSSGWRVIEQTNNYTVVQNAQTQNGVTVAVQTLQIMNNTYNGDVYILVGGPYGWDQYLLDVELPKGFPEKYLGKNCWLRRTKKGNKLVITYTSPVDSEALLFISNGSSATV